MNSAIGDRVKELCESLGGTWAPNDMDWLECRIEGLRVCIGPTTGLVEINSTYGSLKPFIYHDAKTDEALLKIVEIHKAASVQAVRFRKLASDVHAFLLEKKIPAECEMVDSDFVKFTLGDRQLFHIDAEHLLDGGPFVMQVGVDEYGVETLDDVIGCLNKTTAQDVEAPWMCIGPDRAVYYIGDIAYLIPAMIRHGVEGVDRHVGTYWTTSGDTILNILLGNELPNKKDYFSIRFTDSVIPIEVEEVCRG